MSHPTREFNVALIGCGNMGAALARGFRKAAGGCRLVAVDPATERARRLLANTDVDLVATVDAIGTFVVDLVVLAVKPQQIALMDALIARLGRDRPTIVSIAAGVSCATLRRIFGPGAPLVRAMPNTPASLGEGATALFTDRMLEPKRRAQVERFFGSVGIGRWLEREDEIDLVTALSGSGPAYVFALVEQLDLAARHLGLASDVAATFARQTVIGAATVLAQSGESPAALRQAVTSPGGTTEAALGVLGAADGLPDLIARTLQAAVHRGRALRRAADVTTA